MAIDNLKELTKPILTALAIIIVLMLLLMFYWDSEPDSFDVIEHSQYTNQGSSDFVTGFVTTVTLIRVADTLLDKRGGYLSNDITPPSVFMDNIPSWEFGVLTQIRDMARAMRNDFSRSQTQSIEDKDLMIAIHNFILTLNPGSCLPQKASIRRVLMHLEIMSGVYRILMNRMRSFLRVPIIYVIG